MSSYSASTQPNKNGIAICHVTRSSALFLCVASVRRSVFPCAIASLRPASTDQRMTCMRSFVLNSFIRFLYPEQLLVIGEHTAHPLLDFVASSPIGSDQLITRYF